VIISVRAIETGEAAPPPVIACYPYLVRNVVQAQIDLDTVASGHGGFHRLGVLKAAAHRFIVMAQRELTGCRYEFENMDHELFRQLDKKDRDELMSQIASLTTAYRPPETSEGLGRRADEYWAEVAQTHGYSYAHAGHNKVLEPEFSSRPPVMRYKGVQALDVHFENPAWTLKQVASAIDVKPPVLGLMNRTETFLSALGVPVKRHPAAGPTRRKA
jgi:hypothetical protein